MNHGTEEKMVARRLRSLNSAQHEALFARRFRPHQDHIGRMARLAVQQAGDRHLRLLVLAAHGEPVGAFHDKEAAEGDDKSRDQRSGVHPAPGRKIGGRG